jgi:hypothetical protein
LNLVEATGNLSSPALGQAVQALQQSADTDAQTAALNSAANNSVALTQAGAKANLVMQFASMLASIMNKGAENAAKAASGQ